MNALARRHASNRTIHAAGWQAAAAALRVYSKHGKPAKKIIRRRAHIRYGSEEEANGNWEATGGQRGQAELGPVCSAILQAGNR